MTDWRPLPWNRTYEVSSSGFVRSVDRIDANGRRRRGVLLKGVVNKDGYYAISIGGRGAHLIHRLVSSVFHGDCPPDMEVNHRDGVKTNNSIENLEYVSSAENSRHAWSSGLCDSFRGERNRMAKMNDARVASMRQRHLAGESVASLARSFGIGYSTATRIVTREKWKHVQ